MVLFCHHAWHRRQLSVAFALLLFFFLATSLVKGLADGDGSKEMHNFVRRQQQQGEQVVVLSQQHRRLLGGPGSSPPTCRARCGRCYPCRPVRVAIQPGLASPLEYYPEAWRCKCGNKLFMP